MWCEGFEDFGYASVDCLWCSGFGFPQHGLEFGEGLFDGVEIRTVGGQRPDGGTCCFDGCQGSLVLVALQVVPDDDVIGRQGWHEEADHPGCKEIAIHGTVEGADGRDPLHGDVRPVLLAGVHGFF